MRAEILLRFFGRFHLLAALLLLVPMGVGFLDGETHVWPYLGPALFLTALGALLARLAAKKGAPRAEGLRRREGFLLVAMSWILIVLYGAFPYLISGAVDNVADAIFESTSGFTTTGATIFNAENEIESQLRGILFWRSFTHWLGGMGIIVLSVAILPELAVGGMQLFAAESSGINVEKLAPRIAETAKRLWVLYAALTALEILLLLPSMDGFDAVTHAFATTATGGFSPKNQSIGYYDSAYVEGVILIFMFLAGTNFALQYRVLVRGEVRGLFRSSELRLYLGLAVVFSALVTCSLIQTDLFDGLGESSRYAGFHVVSISTTTGFTSHQPGQDFSVWPTFATFLIVILMTIGGCAGSTAGGLKVVRLVVVLKHAAREFQKLLYPRLVRPVTVNRKAIGPDVLWGILGFFMLYMITFVLATIVLTALEHGKQMDLVTAVTASLSALNSIGPGLGHVGPAENFAFLHPAGKLMLSFCMVLGRLEIYTLLIIFLPRFWLTR